MRALVLSGGGAKGAYQMGVWKALKKLNIKFDIVTGTSIGAVNGMLYVQNNYYKCLNLWNNIDFDTLFDDFKIENDDVVLDNYINKILSGGIDTTKMKNLLYQVYNPKKLYKSKIKYGIATYNLSDNKVIYATKANTNPKKLKEYILASATCFPIFKPTKIGSDNYIDGGYCDNMPINLAIDMGATEVLAVDLEAIGITKKVKDESINVKYIRPTSKLDSLLMFDNKKVKRMIKLGYNDAMKFYNKLDGNIYTFKKNTISKIYNLYGYLINKKLKEYKLDEINIKQFEEILEYILELFSIPVEEIYNVKQLLNVLESSILELIKEVDDKLDPFNKKTIIKNLYTKINNNDKINNNIFGILNKDLTAAIVLSVLKR
ncbi:MAG: patatin-like phospholipase family protein [Firmicutes bacterium]|nr:patatin-like phospholipase family protein [Bacillota bacterium]